MEFFKNIEFIGMLCMGGFVGGILNYGLSSIKDEKSFSKITTIIFGAAFSGVVFVFLELLLNLNNGNGTLSSKSIYMYPLGLVLALLWTQTINTIETIIPSKNKMIKTIGLVHIVGLSLFTILLVWKLFTVEIKQDIPKPSNNSDLAPNSMNHWK